MVIFTSKINHLRTSSIFLLLFSLACSSFLRGQASYAVDCDGAIPITTGYFDLPTFVTGPNTIPDEIDGEISCLSNGEQNGIWFEFLTLDSGILSFNIIPYVPTNDYDWALFDLTNNNCSDIFPMHSLEVSCNYSNGVTNGGITGANGGPNNQDEPTLSVVANQYFKLFISNFNGTSNGFQLNFGSSTCGFNPIIGIEANDLQSQIKYSPNPTSGLLNIHINPAILSEVTSVTLFDLQGKMRITISPGYSSEFIIDLSNVPAGLYFLKIGTDQSEISYKVIKQ